MVTRYKSMREKVNDYIKNILNEDFEVEKDFFISNICIDLGCKRELILDIINNYIKAEKVYEYMGLLISTSKRNKKEAEEEMDKILKSTPNEK